MTKGPNILVTGTPGTGKTSLCQLLAERLPRLSVVDVGEIVKTEEFHEGFDPDFQTYILDEERLLDYLEPIMEEGNKVVDFHSCEVFPERFFDLVVVLRCTTEVLYDRLVLRNYSDKKINENMECEIMQVVLESARDSYDERIVQELPSNSVEDMESNVSRIGQWYAAWMANNT